MLPLAAAGFHVVAPDQRGYGRTTGWDGDYDGDLARSACSTWCAMRSASSRRSAIARVAARGRARLRLAGRGLVRAAAAGRVPLRGADERAVRRAAGDPVRHRDAPPTPRPRPARTIHDDLAALDPPRKHYHWYYSTRPANADMRNCPQGIHAFLRAYYHHKSADWKGNTPYKLDVLERRRAGQAADLLRDGAGQGHGRDRGAAHAVSAAEIAACEWLHRRRSSPCTAPSTRSTGFQGGLKWYRCRTSGRFDAELRGVLRPHHRRAVLLHRRARATGASTRRPAPSSGCRATACTQHAWPATCVDGAGHWVQQEQPEAVSRLLLEFLRRAQ